jgi:hypothetical protein
MRRKPSSSQFSTQGGKNFVLKFEDVLGNSVPVKSASYSPS